MARPGRSTVILAIASFLTFSPSVPGMSSPWPPTGDAAPMLVPGAMSAMFAASVMNVPALAAKSAGRRDPDDRSGPWRRAASPTMSLRRRQAAARRVQLDHDGRRAVALRHGRCRRRGSRPCAVDDRRWSAGRSTAPGSAARSGARRHARAAEPASGRAASDGVGTIETVPHEATSAAGDRSRGPRLEMLEHEPAPGLEVRSRPPRPRPARRTRR